MRYVRRGRKAKANRSQLQGARTFKRRSLPVQALSAYREEAPEFCTKARRPGSRQHTMVQKNDRFSELLADHVFPR
jgi:hypothetical protein